MVARRPVIAVLQAALVAVFVLLCAPEHAFAAIYRDDATQFSITLPERAGQILCIRVPESELMPGCPAGEHRVVGYALGERPIVGGTVIDGDWSFGFVVTVTSRSGIGEVSEQAIDSIGKDLAAQLQTLGFGMVSAVGSKPFGETIVQIRGLTGLHFSADLDAPAGSALEHVEVYCLYHQNYAHTLMLFAPRAHAREVQDFGASILDSIQSPPSDVRLFGRPRMVRDVQFMVMRSLPLLAVFALVALVLLVRARGKNATTIKQPARPTPQPEPADEPAPEPTELRKPPSLRLACVGCGNLEEAADLVGRRCTNCRDASGRVE